MPTVTFKGKTVKLKGNLPKLNSEAEDFTFVKNDLSEQSLYDLGDLIKVIIAVPSLDTGVCAAEARKFNEKLGTRSHVVGVVISKDLPFAQKRFCETDGIKNIITVSDFRYSDFTQTFNTEMIDGPLKGLSARAVFVLDEDNVITYSELVPEVTTEPDYDKILKAVDDLI
jgi:thiol peroxidase